jgi:hypothetical protein
VSIGGSTGQSELLSLDVDEGRLDVSFHGRKWDVEVLVGQEAWAAARTRQENRKERAAQRKATQDDIAVLQAIDQEAGQDGVAVARRVRLACGWGTERFGRTVARLVRDGWAEEVEATVTKGGGAKQTCAGLRRTDGATPKGKQVEE